MKRKYYVENMTCSACSAFVENAVKKIKGVKSVTVNLVSTEMFVESEVNLDKKIEEALKKTGYKLVYEKVSDKVSNKKQKIIISTILGIILLYISMGHMVGLSNIIHDKRISGIIELVLTIIIVILNNHYFVSGFKKLFAFKPNMDSLVAIGSTTSFIYSIVLLVNVFIDNSKSVHFYFDSCAMILILVSIGKYLESKSKNKSLEAITKLMKLSPNECVVLENNEEVTKKSKDVKINDVTICKQGSIIPFDGVIVNGSGYIDESNITGESIPVYKTIGDPVTSSTHVLSGCVNVKVLKEYEDNTINQIIRLVNEASNSKAKVSRIVDVVAFYFTYVVMLISLISFTVFCFLENISFALNIGISVLVISCPCALGLATPLAITIGMTEATKSKILVKDAKVLENVCKINKIVFDKTKTVTKGEMVVSSYTDDKTLQIAYCLELNSNHPLALAIVNKAKELNFEKLNVTNFNTIEGVGVTADIDNITYKATNIKGVNKNLLNDEKILSLDKASSNIIISTNTNIIGVITIKDEIKQEAKEVIEKLSKMKISSVLLTGDKKETGEMVSKELNINEVYTEVLPKDKQEIVKKLSETMNVCMVGDGVNDAIALTEALVGITIKNASDIAIDSADCVLLNSDLNSIIDLIKISKKVVKTIKVNLFWAFFYNVIGISCACGLFYYSFGILMNPMICALSMSLSSIFVCVNSLSIKLNRKDKVMKKIYIENMNCMHCVKRIEEVLSKVKGITYKISLDEKSVEINGDEKKIEKAIKVIEKAGYNVI